MNTIPQLWNHPRLDVDRLPSSSRLWRRGRRGRGLILYTIYILINGLDREVDLHLCRSSINGIKKTTYFPHFKILWGVGYNCCPLEVPNVSLSHDHKQSVDPKSLSSHAYQRQFKQLWEVDRSKQKQNKDDEVLNLLCPLHSCDLDESSAWSKERFWRVDLIFHYA